MTPYRTFDNEHRRDSGGVTKGDPTEIARRVLNPDFIPAGPDARALALEVLRRTHPTGCGDPATPA